MNGHPILILLFVGAILTVGALYWAAGHPRARWIALAILAAAAVWLAW